MRIPSGKVDQKISFVAFDSTDAAGLTMKTGLSSFTVYRSRNGGTATIYTTPTIAEVDAANMPGVYNLLVDEDTTIASTSDSEEMVLRITATGMYAVTRDIELYRRDTTSGQTVTVANGAADADIERIQGTVVSTPATAGILDVNVKNIDNDAASASGTVTFPNATLASTTNITAGTITTVTTTTTATNVTTVNGLAAGVITATSIASNAITSAKIATDAIGAAQIAADAIGASELAADAVTEIGTGVWATTVRVLTANTNLNDLSAAGVRAAVGLASANLDTQIAAVQSDTDNIQTRLPTSLVSGRMDSSVGAMATDTLTAAALAADAVTEIQTGLATSAAVAAIPTANANADALLDRAAGVETGQTVRQGLRLMLAALVGKVSGFATSAPVYRDTNDSKNRISATTTTDGRTAVTLDNT